MNFNRKPLMTSLVIIKPKINGNLKGISNVNQRTPIDIFKSKLT